jgi:hypothetical protein
MFTYLSELIASLTNLTPGARQHINMPKDRPLKASAVSCTLNGHETRQTFEDPGQFRVAVGHDGSVLVDRFNDIAQDRQ